MLLIIRIRIICIFIFHIFIHLRNLLSQVYVRCQTYVSSYATYVRNKTHVSDVRKRISTISRNKYKATKRILIPFRHEINQYRVSTVGDPPLTPPFWGPYSSHIAKSIRPYSMKSILVR